MINKICMVTGATGGIGKETAAGLARMGATIVIVGRNEEKAAAVVDEIHHKTRNSRVEALIADFASLGQIRDLAGAFSQRHDRLDVLINNAGIVTRERQISEDGFELMFAVNYLAPFLLTNLLLDSLRASIPARVVNVSSMGYKNGQINFANLQSTHNFNHRQAYYQTRLAIVLFTLALARRLEGTGVVANCVHPGIVRTNLSHNYMGNPIFRFFEQLIAVAPEKGAKPSIFLASAPEIEGVNGQYFHKMEARSIVEPARNQGLQERLWDTSEALIEQTMPYLVSSL